MNQDLALKMLSYYWPHFKYTFFENILKTMGILNEDTSKNLKLDQTYRIYASIFTNIIKIPCNPFRLDISLIDSPLPFNQVEDIVWKPGTLYTNIPVYSFMYRVEVQNKMDLHELFWQLILF